MDAPKRVVIVGKTGVGKSSLANTIFGETVFKITKFNDLSMHCCQAETKSIDGRSITLIDTPGFFDPERSEDEIKPEIVRCITECAPGPHAFLIVLKVEKFTEHEQAVIDKMCQYFSKDALKYAAVVFTRGDQLTEGLTIDEYVRQSKGLSNLAKKCGGRCHVVDNKYWKNNQQDEYRNNQFQVRELLNTINKIVMDNNGRHYSNKTLQKVERAIQEEEKRIRNSSGKLSQDETRKQAKSIVFKKQMDNEPERGLKWIKFLVGFSVMAAVITTVSAVLISSKCAKVSKEPPTKREILAAPVAAVVKEQIADTVSTINEAAEGIRSPVVVIKRTIEIIMDRLHALYERTCDPWNLFE